VKIRKSSNGIGVEELNGWGGDAVVILEEDVEFDVKEGRS